MINAIFALRKNKKLVLVLLLILTLGCVFRQNQKKQIKNMNYNQALKFVSAYADYQKIPFDDVLDINDGERFRGNVYNIEFEFKPHNHILIARGYVFDGADRFIRPDIWNVFLEIEKDPNSSLTRTILPGRHLNLVNRTFEIDTTIKELLPDYLYRLNLRMEFSFDSLSIKEFIKEMKCLADDSYLWDKSYFKNVVEYCNIDFFQNQAKYYINCFAKLKNFYPVVFLEDNNGFTSLINSLQFKYEKDTQNLFISYEIPTTMEINSELFYYNSKIKSDSLWYWMASLIIKNNKLFLSIKIGDYSQTEKEFIGIIEHCTNSLNFWKQNL